MVSDDEDDDDDAVSGGSEASDQSLSPSGGAVTAALMIHDGVSGAPALCLVKPPSGAMFPAAQLRPPAPRVRLPLCTLRLLAPVARGGMRRGRTTVTCPTVTTPRQHPQRPTSRGRQSYVFAHPDTGGRALGAFAHC